jgi:hypothetical protein
VFDFFFDLFRKEKPLYRWRERPSLSAFLTQVGKSERPMNYWNRMLRMIGMYLLFTLGLLVFRGVIGYAANPDQPFFHIKDAVGALSVSFLFLIGLEIFQNFEDRIIELHPDRLVAQNNRHTVPYSRLEYFRITQMRHASSGARFPCVALYTNLGESDQVDTFGLPNPKVAARVQEVLSKFVPFRASEPNDDLEFKLN